MGISKVTGSKRTSVNSSALPLLRLFDVLIKTFFVLILLGGDWLEFLFDRMG